MTEYSPYPPAGTMPAERTRRRFLRRRAARRQVVPPRSMAVNTTVVRRSPLYGMAALVCFIAGVIEAFLALRIVFKALAANAGAGFVDVVYRVASPFMAPFGGILGNNGLGNGGVLESAAVIAFAVWGVAALLLVTLVRVATPSRSAA